MKPKIHMADKLFECPAEFKAVADEDNIVEGYASVFNVVDSYGDVVLPGAFKKTIKERIPKRLVPFVADHRYEVNSLLGTIVKAAEDSEGLQFKAELSAVPSVQDVRTKMLEGHLSRVSFGFKKIGEKFAEDVEVIDGKQVYRYLNEVMLLDIAPVVLAANERARITQVKSIHELMTSITDLELDADDLQIAGARLLRLAEEVEAKIWEDTESEIRWRVKDPKLFDPDTFRSKDVGKGIRLVMGKLKKPPEGQEGSMVTQSVRFNKDKGWDMAKAKAWAKDHPDLTKGMAAEPVDPLTAKTLEVESQSIAIDMDIMATKLGGL